MKTIDLINDQSMRNDRTGFSALAYQILFFHIAVLISAVIYLFYVELNGFEHNKLVTYSSLSLFFCLVALLSCVTLDQIRLRTSVIIFLVIGYLVVCLVWYKTIFYIDTGDFFDYQRKDTVFYHEQAQGLLKYGFFDGVARFLKGNNWFDLGAVVYAYSLYLIVDSPLSIDVANLLLSIVTVIIVRRYLLSVIYDEKIANYTVLIFALSSFYWAFHFTHYKETLLTAILISSFYAGYCFSVSKRAKYLLVFCLLIAFLVALRPILAVLVLASIISVPVFKAIRLLMVGRIKYVSFSLFLVIVAVSPYLMHYFSIYLSRFGGAVLTNRLSELAGGDSFSALFLFVISIFSALFGPIPNTVATDGSEINALYSYGVILKLVLAPIFIIGVIKTLLSKSDLLLPLIIFYFGHSISLGYALRGFDVRFLVVQFPIYAIFLGVGLAAASNSYRLISPLLFASMSACFFLSIALFVS